MQPKIIPAAYEAGLAMYRSGASLRQIIDAIPDQHAAHKAAETEEAHQEIENTPPSLMAGFFDGFINDVRVLAHGRGQRA